MKIIVKIEIHSDRDSESERSRFDLRLHRERVEREENRKSED